MTTKRTTHRSTKGRKLYAVRDKAGKFKDVQTYKRAHSRDLRTRSREECAEKVGVLIDAARWLRIATQPAKRRAAIAMVCAASAAADAAIAKAVKARTRKVAA